MAAAIILIPEMLSGPERHEDRTAERPAEREQAIKTYTIDLDKPQGSAAQAALDERAPPPEAATQQAADPQTENQEIVAQQRAPADAETRASDETPPETAVDAQPTTSTARTARVDAPTPAPPVRTPPAQSDSAQRREPAATRESTETRPPAPSLASEPDVPTTKGWAVQLGSFSSRATAEQLAKEFRADGHRTFVMPVKSGAATLYRVRIGPMTDRASADATLARVKTKVPGAAVVVHP